MRFRGSIGHRLASALDDVTYRLHGAPFSERFSAYEKIEKSLLKGVTDAATRKEIRRRVTEAEISAATTEPPATLVRLLKRLERLGFSMPHVAAWAAALASNASSDPEAHKIGMRLVRKAHQLLKASRAAPQYKLEQRHILEGVERRINSAPGGEPK